MFEYVLFRTISEILWGQNTTEQIRNCVLKLVASLFLVLLCVIDFQLYPIQNTKKKEEERCQKCNLVVKDKLSPNLVDVFFVPVYPW